MAKGNRFIRCKECRQVKLHEARGLCHTCYVRLKRNNGLSKYPLKGGKGGRSIIVCSECGQLIELEAKGLCRNCYVRRQQRNNKKEKPIIKCAYCGQLKKLQSKGLCKACYSRAWKNDGIPRDKKKRPVTIGECQDCKEIKRLTKNRCKKCYLNYLRKNNPEKYKAYNDKYKLLPERKQNALKNKRLRRSRIREVESNLTEQEWQDILKRYNHCCAYCGAYADKLHREHWIPLIKGGGYTASNIVPACKKCNSRKHTMTGDEFLAILQKEKEYAC